VRKGIRQAAVPATLLFLAFAVVAFSGGWAHGRVTLDGTGQSLYLRLAVEEWRHTGHLSYWLPDMWAGTPIWSIAASLPVVVMLPVARVFGPDAAVKLGCLLGQVLGAFGAFWLARDLWGRTWAAPLAGLFYGLSPIFISQSYFGVDRASIVIGLAPWFIWAFRRSLRGEGRRAGLVAMVGAGLLAGAAVLEQAEQAYAFLLPVACLLPLELTRAARRARGAGAGRSANGRAGLTPRQVLGRTAGVAGVALGVSAHWLLPFLALQKAFVLSPRWVINHTLVTGIAGDLARDLGGFLTRSPGVHPVTTFPIDLIGLGCFYLGWLLVTGTAAGMALAPRHDGQGDLSAILLASAFCVWLSTGAIPLAASGPAENRNLVPFVVIGITSGLLLGTFLRHLRLRRWAVAAGLTVAVLLVSLPYLTPFLTLRSLIPFLGSIRFPRFYTLSILGLALGAAFPVAVLQRSLRAREPRLGPLLAAALALVLAGVFAVDIHSYRSYYRSQPPDPTDAFAKIADPYNSGASGNRLSATQWGDPSVVNTLVRAGAELSTGWPHPVAAKDVWRVTAEIVGSPGGYRDRALALSATTGSATEQVVHGKNGAAIVDRVDIEPNPEALPRVRAYDHTVVVGNDELGVELAVNLSQQGIGTVTGGGGAARALGPARTVLPSGVGCDSSGEVAKAGPSAPDVAMACAALTHIRFEDALSLDRLPVDDTGTGAIFDSPINGLRGVAVWLDSGPGLSELALYEVGADGKTLGREVTRTYSSGFDANDMVSFTFDPIPDSAGKRYAFLVNCSHCPADQNMGMLVTKDRSRAADVIHDGKVAAKTTGVFMPEYAGTSGDAGQSTTTVRPTELGAGRWRVATSGTKPSLVVVADAYFPGWKARVDGKSAPVLKADGAFLGVAVGPGQHMIDLSYHRPPAALVGRVISVTTVVVIILWLLDEQWRTKLATQASGRSAARPRPVQAPSNGAARRPGGGSHTGGG
jgi:hypothetical protein